MSGATLSLSEKELSPDNCSCSCRTRTRQDNIIFGRTNNNNTCPRQEQLSRTIVLDKNKIRNGQYCPDKNKTRLEKVGQV